MNYSEKASYCFQKVRKSENTQVLFNIEKEMSEELYIQTDKQKHKSERYR